MLLRLPATLHYPIIIRKVEKQVDDEIKHRDVLFTYTYIGKVTHQDRYTDEEVEVNKVFPAHFQSTLEGTIQSWLVWEGDEIREPRDILDVNESCKHSVQFNGMCVECGRDMTEYVLLAQAEELLLTPTLESTSQVRNTTTEQTSKVHTIPTNYSSPKTKQVKLINLTSVTS